MDPNLASSPLCPGLFSLYYKHFTWLWHFAGDFRIHSVQCNLTYNSGVPWCVILIWVHCCRYKRQLCVWCKMWAQLGHFQMLTTDWELRNHTYCVLSKVHDKSPDWWITRWLNGAKWLDVNNTSCELDNCIIAGGIDELLQKPPFDGIP